MCQVTSTLKLCTCKTNKNPLRNYWVYNCIEPGKNICINGITFIKSSLVYPLNVSNKKGITRMLNTGNAFDFEIVPQEMDELYLYFTKSVGDCYNKATYSFAFTNGKWCSIPYDPIMIEWHHKTLLTGKIRNGLNPCM